MSESRYLVRYGAVPEVVRCTSALADELARDAQVVVETERGVRLGVVLERLRGAAGTDEALTPLVRRATDADRAQAERLARLCDAEFPRWVERIQAWDLALELVDLERTLDDSKWILYVLTERGPDATRLALQAAAAGLGVIDVLPIAHEGVLALGGGGGCGSGGCGCGH